MRTASTAAIIGAAIIYTALASGAAAQEPNFSGNWRLDPRMSQDPYEKVELALGTFDDAENARRGLASDQDLLDDLHRALQTEGLSSQARAVLLSKLEQLEARIASRERFLDELE